MNLTVIHCTENQVIYYMKIDKGNVLKVYVRLLMFVAHAKSFWAEAFLFDGRSTIVMLTDI